MKLIKINSIEELKSSIENNDFEYFINFGLARSSKHIELNKDDTFYIYNEIDDSEDVFTEKQLKESNIGIAIERGSFYKY